MIVPMFTVEFQFAGPVATCSSAGTSTPPSVGSKGKAATGSVSSKPVNRLNQLKKQKKQLNQTTGDTTLTARKEKEVA
jgi:hypothetical protein